MKNKKKLIPIVAIVLMGSVFTVIVKKSSEPLSVNTILRYTPENAMLAAGIVLLLFALKSLTIVSCKWNSFPACNCGFNQYSRTCNYDYDSIFDWKIFRKTDCAEDMSEISESRDGCEISENKYLFCLLYYEDCGISSWRYRKHIFRSV